MTSGFAMRQHPLSNNWRAHLGVDYGAPQGTAVRTVGDGVIEFAGRQNGYGNVVQVRHSQERSTLYAHLSAIDVKNGQRIEQGQRIGAVGATGFATGPHLHFEFRVSKSEPRQEVRLGLRCRCEISSHQSQDRNHVRFMAETFMRLASINDGIKANTERRFGRHAVQPVAPD